ncbi:MAG: hypothetical protein AAB961_00420 [Patescibacteria group bacterium]
MAKYVPDVKTQRWVVIAPKRKSRPGDDKSVCPFCVGNEALTPPEVYRIGSGEKDKPGWIVRVVPNLFPITDIHEVIIHSPDDTRDIEKLSLDQVTKILTVYRDRYRAHENDGQVLIFCNHGFHAGASRKHPHSQLVVVPKQINLDVLSREPVTNIVEESKIFSVFCPEFSQWPYETWIVPRDGGTRFGDTADSDLPKLAHMLQYTLQRIERVFLKSPVTVSDRTTQFVYNYYIFPGEKWYLRIIPRFIHRAGFELGTGLNVNIVDPVDAAEDLGNIKDIPVE